MKIYFTASLTGKKIYKKNYELIIDTIKNCGYLLVSDHILKEEKEKVFKKTAEETKTFYNKDYSWISKSDIVIAEASYPSVNVGYEIAIAFAKNKPIIVLHTEEKQPTLLLEAFGEDKVKIIPYNLDNLQQNLKIALEDAKKKIDIRFTMLLPPETMNYLKDIAKEKKVSMSEFIRKLIEKEKTNK